MDGRKERGDAVSRTEAERLTRIETLLEAAVFQRTEDRDAMREKLDDVANDVKAIRAEVEADKADLAALKNKGTGILIGVGLAGGAIGAAIAELFGSLFK